MKKVFLILFIFTLINGVSQVRFGKITKEELLCEKSDINQEAVAEILSKEAIISIEPNTNEGGFETFKEIKVRIKIYNKDEVSNELLNIEIPIYKNGSTKEKITNIKASTYNLEQGKIVESKVRSSDVFIEEVSKYLEVQKFAFQNVKDGSVLEYKYFVRTPRIFDLDTWYFQSGVPTKYSKYYVSYPEFFTYRPDLRGELLGNSNKDYKRTAYNYRDITEEYVYKNVPALKDEPFVQNTNNLKGSIRYELIEYNNPGYGYEGFAKTWNQITKDLALSSSYGGALKGNSFLNDEANKFLKIESLEDRLISIFSYVKDNYNWNDYYGLYPDNGVRKTYKEKVGNGTDINFLLISLLNKSGISAYPVVLSTVKNGMLNIFPSARKLNHTITGVVINNNIYLMDPIGKYSKINMLPTNDLNFYGFMLMEQGNYKKIDLVNYIPSKIENTITYKIEDELILGKFIQTKTNYFAMEDLKDKSSDEQNFQEDFLSDYEADFTDFSYKVNSTSDAIRYSVDFQESESVQSVAGKIFIKPLLFLSTDSNAFKFKNEERQFPLEFGTPFTFKSTAKIEIPKGYMVESLPKQKTVQLSQEVGGFTINFVTKDDKIIVQSLIHVSYSNLPATFYKEIKDMYQQVVEKENEQIILKKQ